MAIANSYLKEAVRRANSGESEAAFRARLVANLRAEGCSDAQVARYSDDHMVKTMMAHQTQAVEAITSLFASIGGRTA